MNAEDPVGRFESLRVRDIMIPLEEYPTVVSSTPLRLAIAVMDAAKLEVQGRMSLPRMLLVLDEEGRLVGHLRRRDVMRGLEPKYLLSEPLHYRKKLFDVGVDPNLSELSTGRVVRGIREQAERPVADVMLPIQGSLDVEDHLITALYEMGAYRVSLLPVFRQKRPAGVVRSVEVFGELARLLIPPAS